MRVFLSYHTPDHSAADALKAAIERAHRAVEVFFAPYNLRLGAFWLPQLGDAIAGSDAFLLLMGKRLGEWQKLEYYEAVNRHLAARKAGNGPYPVVPVIAADRAPNLPFLGQLHWIESTEPTAPEPLKSIIDGLRGIAIAAPRQRWRTINPYRGCWR